MSIEKERKAFEEWAYSNKWNINRFRDMGIDKYVDDFVDAAWHGWQASANRQGYKLIPIEPTKEMLIAADGCVIDGKVTSNNIYKAMIGVIE